MPAPSRVLPVLLIVRVRQVRLGPVIVVVVVGRRLVVRVAPALRRRVLPRRRRKGCQRRRVPLHGPHRALALPQRRVRLYALRRRAAGNLLPVVHLADLGDGQLAAAVLEPLENLLGGDFAAAAKQVGVVEQGEELIGYLLALVSMVKAGLHFSSCHDRTYLAKLLNVDNQRLHGVNHMDGLAV